jgi:beta-mannosidase
MSEFGFQSFPQIETVNSYTDPADRDIESPVMLAHQRHPRGNQLVREYMLREYPQPKDFESFLYVSQVLQAEGIRLGAEHLRRIRPRNMGSLYWQIDDCWPVASWSSIDYYARWKALQYYARRFYSNLLVTPRIDNANLNFWVTSDQTKIAAAKLHVELLDFDGHVLKSFDRNLSIAPLASRSYFGVPVEDLLQGQDAKSSFVYCELLVNGKVVSDHDYFFAPFKDLRLRKPAIQLDVAATRQGFRVTVASNGLARAAYLSASGLEGAFSDNYFDLMPGQRVTVEYQSRERLSVSQFRERLKIVSLVDAF